MVVLLRNNLGSSIQITSKKELEKSLQSLLQAEYKLLKRVDLQTGFNELLESFAKQKINLSLDKKEELQTWFKTKQSELGNWKEQIESLDYAIDQEVYKLYNLTGEEIKIIEDSLETK